MTSMDEVLKVIGSEDQHTDQYYTCVAEAQTSGDKLRSYLIANKILKKVKRISHGAYGDVYITDSMKPAIIKTSRVDMIEDEDLINELYIGLIGINSILDHIPNFMRTYGYLKCGPIYTPVDSDKPIAWSLPGDNMHMVAEYIEHGTLYDKLMNGMNVEEVLHVLIQLICAMRFAAKHRGFLHRDLHSGNILLSYNAEGKSVVYPDSRIRMISTITPIIIDYGRSTLSYKVSEDDLLRDISTIVNIVTSVAKDIVDKNIMWSKYLYEEVLKAMQFITNNKSGVVFIDPDTMKFNVTIDQLIDNIIVYAQQNNLGIGVFANNRDTTPIVSLPTIKSLPITYKPAFLNSIDNLYISNSARKIRKKYLDIILIREFKWIKEGIKDVEDSMNAYIYTEDLISNSSDSDESIYYNTLEQSEDILSLLTNAILILISFKVVNAIHGTTHYINRENIDKIVRYINDIINELARTEDETILSFYNSVRGVDFHTYYS
jgi:serine/threonine protein kinase